MAESMEYVWRVDNVNYKLVDGSNENVITEVNWRAYKTINTHTAKSTGVVALSAPSGTFITYENLTELQVIEWAKEALGSTRVTEIEAEVNAKVTELVTPTTGFGV